MTLRQLRTLGAWDLRQKATRLGGISPTKVTRPNQGHLVQDKATPTRQLQTSHFPAAHSRVE